MVPDVARLSGNGVTRTVVHRGTQRLDLHRHAEGKLDALSFCAQVDGFGQAGQSIGVAVRLGPKYSTTLHHLDRDAGSDGCDRRPVDRAML